MGPLADDLAMATLGSLVYLCWIDIWSISRGALAGTRNSFIWLEVVICTVHLFSPQDLCKMSVNVMFFFVFPPGPV